MDFTPDERQLLAQLVELCPDVGNFQITTSVLSRATLALLWDREKTRIVYDGIKGKGGVISPMHTDFLTQTAFDEGIRAAAENKRLAIIEAEKKETAHKHREIRLVILGGIIGIPIGLLIAYLVHLFHWV